MAWDRDSRDSRDRLNTDIAILPFFLDLDIRRECIPVRRLLVEKQCERSCISWFDSNGRRRSSQ